MGARNWQRLWPLQFSVPRKMQSQKNRCISNRERRKIAAFLGAQNKSQRFPRFQKPHRFRDAKLFMLFVFLFFLAFWEFPNLVVQTWLFAIFTRKRSFALICALLGSFTLSRLPSLICALLCVSASNRVWNDSIWKLQTFVFCILNALASEKSSGYCGL